MYVVYTQTKHEIFVIEQGHKNLISFCIGFMMTFLHHITSFYYLYKVVFVSVSINLLFMKKAEFLTEYALVVNEIIRTVNLADLFVNQRKEIFFSIFKKYF